MAQFRTTADILDEVLQKAGEPTNGNSAYETLARTYANRVHHKIIGGGNLFNLNVDDPWVWARSRHPIVIELQPPYSTGAASCTVNDVNITFTIAPASSLEGWHFQINGRTTVYKIVQHTAGEAAAVLDSSFVDDSGAYSYRAFKLDYEILPEYVYVDNYNDRLDFQAGTAFTTGVATLSHGSYTLSGLVAHAAARMDTASTATIGASYDSVLKLANFTCSSSFRLLGASGANIRRSGWPALGFDQLDQTGAQTYASAYVPNAVSRLIEPFRLFSGSGSEPFIYSTDPIKMQQDYPLALVQEKTPERFVRMNEGSDGTVWVRFSSYPKYKTKVQIDWIPSPIDLQDNTASVPKLPRADVDVLIDGAAAMLCIDKEDSKAEAYFGSAKAGLEAMQRRNRSALFRTGETFAQIVPRADLDGRERRLNYGYTSGSQAAGSTASATDVLISVTLSYAAFQTGATINSVLGRTLPSTRSLYSVIMKHNQAFTGALVSALTMDLGVTGDPTYFLSGFDVMQSVSGTAQASFVGVYYPATDTGIYVRANSVGANLSALGQGSLVLYFQESIVP